MESRHGFVPRPNFLMHPLPEHRENAERSQRSTAPLPRRSQSTTTTSVLSSDAADGRATCRSSSAAADLQAAGQPSGAAAADLRAPSPSSPADERAADSSQGAPAAAERGSVNPGLRRRQNANQPRSFPLYVTEMGQKYHSDVQCRGLRNARSFTNVSTLPHLWTCAVEAGPGSLWPWPWSCIAL